MRTDKTVFLLTTSGKAYDDPGIFHVYSLVGGEGWVTVHTGPDLLSPATLLGLIGRNPDAGVVVSAPHGVFLVSESVRELLSKAIEDGIDSRAALTPPDPAGLPEQEYAFKAAMIRGMAAFCSENNISYEIRPLGPVFETDIAAPAVATTESGKFVIRAVGADSAIGQAPGVSYIWRTQWDDGTPDIGIVTSRAGANMPLPYAVSDKDIRADADNILSSAVRGVGAWVELNNPDKAPLPISLRGMALNAEGDKWINPDPARGQVALIRIIRRLEKEGKRALAESVADTLREYMGGEAYGELEKRIAE